MSRPLRIEYPNAWYHVMNRFYGIGEERLLVSRRGVLNEPRNMAIFLTRCLRNDSLKQICEQFEMNKYSSVSSIIERMKALVKKERKLRKRVEKLISELMSQEQTWPLFWLLKVVPSFSLFNLLDIMDRIINPRRKNRVMNIMNLLLLTVSMPFWNSHK